jgi:N12 class adenine-specific DNA methylase
MAGMTKFAAKRTEEEGQLSLFDELSRLLHEGAPPLSAKEMTRLMSDLGRARDEARRREAEERKRRKQEEEKRRIEQEKQKWAAHVEEVTCMDLPLDWENLMAADERTRGVHADSVADGLILSLSNLGRVDIEYIAAVTGASCREVITALRGSIYQDPEQWEECFYKGWETAEAYLSGNLMRKWQVAWEANRKYPGWFAPNLKALEAALPPAVAAKDIYVTLGSPWVPADVIDDFITHLYRGREWVYLDRNGNNYYATQHDELTGSWEIPCKTRNGHGILDTDAFGTPRMETLSILEKTLNMRSLTVMDEVVSTANASGKARVINREETLLALEKQKKLIAEFQRWVWQDPKRRERLEEIFETRYSSVRRRLFDGSFLTFPTMSPEVTLYPYQKNAVARILFTPNVLLAHELGSGKTFVMAAACMELRRMGLSKKNLYVVPNNLVGQWREIFLRLYPQAKLLCVEPAAFTPARRQEVLKRMHDEDLDGIIMAYSCFEQIPLSQDYYIEKLQEAREQVSALMSTRGKHTGALDKKRDKLQKQLTELGQTLSVLSSEVYFDELGVTRLFVDEAHNFKNVPIETKVSRVPGISAGGSKKCADMLDKVRFVQKCGGGVIFATGTPITNSVTDAYVMQLYLQPGELALLDLQHFDSWLGMFAEKTTAFEIDVDTSGYRLATRFTRFHNLPELTALLGQVADFHRLDGQNGLPDFGGYTDALLPKTPEFASYLKGISQRAELVRKGGVNRRADNMLLITTDGRKAALDLRLVDPASAFTLSCKAMRCAENAAALYHKTEGTQLIFCDSSTPKAGFNLYDELKRLLVCLEVDPDEIAFVHEATTEKRRETLFRRMREGKVRILIGSTFKLGLGVNVQDRLIALHHLDVPWRPADMTQREGRILRQGNRNPLVFIYRYITEGSFDAYSWQLLETKQRFITGLLSGSWDERSGADIEDTVLSYAEVKALAVGDPTVRERVETANTLSRLVTLRRKATETRLRLEKELRERPNRQRWQRELIGRAQADAARWAELVSRRPAAPARAEKLALAARRKALRERLFAAVSDNVLSGKERFLMDYEGFRVLLPANMQKEKPYVWLEGQGRYYVELGDTELGGLIRIDNFLEHFPAHIEKLREGLLSLREREAQIRRELAGQEDYGERIEALSAKLRELDEKLGVKKDE